MSNKDNSQFPEDDAKKGSIFNVSRRLIVTSGIGVIFIIIISFGVMVYFTESKLNAESEQPIPTSYQDALRGQIKSPNVDKDTSTKTVSLTPLVSKKVANKVISKEIKQQTSADVRSLQHSIDNNFKQTNKALTALLSGQSNTQKVQQKIKVTATNNQSKNLTVMQTILDTLGIISQKQKNVIVAEKIIDKVEFDLVSIGLWDYQPQATIKFQGKVSVVEIGDVRLGWKIKNIDFDKEQITILRNGKSITLEKIR